MFRKLLIVAAAMFLFAGAGLAWNRAGHMVMGAIAYNELRGDDAGTITRVIAILRQHPQYESRWKPQMESMSVQDQERYLFMLAARWPDDIRGDKALDHPMWHYIDYPYKPKGQSASVPALGPAAENLVEAFRQNVAVVKSAAPDAEKAVALCWVFHLLGDSHQPLHAVSLFTMQFPDGDRGGNLFFIRPDPSSPGTQNLHAYWDNILLTDEHYEAAQALARKIENSRERVPLKAPAESRIEMWVRRESFELAVSTAYRKGKLQAGIDKDHGAPLPPDYQASVKRVAEHRVPLAGYRLADFLRMTFPGR